MQGQVTGNCHAEEPAVHARFISYLLMMQSSELFLIVIATYVSFPLLAKLFKRLFPDFLKGTE